MVFNGVENSSFLDEIDALYTINIIDPVSGQSLVSLSGAANGNSLISEVLNLSSLSTGTYTLTYASQYRTCSRNLIVEQ